VVTKLSLTHKFMI